MTPLDYEEFTRETSYYPGPQFGGVIAWFQSGGNEVVMGAVGLDSWTPTSVMAHWWIRHPRCILPLWAEVTGYLAKYGKRKVIGSTPSDNVRALRTMTNKLGFVEVARIRDAWNVGIDLVITEHRIEAALRLEAAA